MGASPRLRWEGFATISATCIWIWAFLNIRQLLLSSGRRRSRCFWPPWCDWSSFACDSFQVVRLMFSKRSLSKFDSISVQELGTIALWTHLRRKSHVPLPPWLLQSPLMAQSAPWERFSIHSSCLPVSWSVKTCRWEGVASILPPWYQQPRWQCLLQKRYS